MKKLITILIIVIMMISILEIKVKANNQIQVTKTIVDDNRSIDLSFKNIPTLENGCKWGITDKKDSETVKKWYDIKEYDKTKNTLNVKLNVVDDDIQNIIKSTDSIYFYIKNEENEFKVEDYNINIKLPITKAFTLDKTIFYDDKILDHFAYNISALYNIQKQYYVLQKVTDENIISKYNKNLKLEDFENIIDETKIPKSGWVEAKESVYQMDATSIKGLPNSILKSEAGIYYVWIKAEDEQSKTIYGVALIKIGEIIQDNNKEENNNTNKKPNEGSEIKKPNETTNKEQNKNDNIKPDTNIKKDNTIANKSIPQTGESYIVIGVITATTLIGVFFYIKFNKYKEIK